jgi:glucokinase
MDAGARPRASRHLGLDVGATNLKWAVAERRDGVGWTTVARDRVVTRVAADPDRVPAMLLEQLVEVAAYAVGAAGPVESVGVAVPGRYDATAGEIRFLPNVPGSWSGVPVAGPVAAAVGVPATLINDARAFGLAELRLGAGRGAKSMIGLTLGTGIGGAIAIDGHVLQGLDGSAGEIGHQTLDPDGPPCGCGNRGCLEAFARADQIALACGTRTAEEAIAQARAGDARAVEGLARIGRYLGIGIANLVTLVTPEVVILGGGTAAATDLLRVPIFDELRLRVRMTSIDRIGIVAAELGTWAGAIGAAIHGAEVDRGSHALDPAAVPTQVVRR